MVMTTEFNTGRMVTQKFTDSVKIKLRAKTDSTSIRMRYKKSILILNWCGGIDELRIYDIFTPDVGKGYANRGRIPVDEFVDIEWIIGRKVMAVRVNGGLRHVGCDHSYIKAYANDPDFSIETTISVEPAWGSTVTVESLEITEL